MDVFANRGTLAYLQNLHCRLSRRHVIDGFLAHIYLFFHSFKVFEHLLIEISGHFSFVSKPFFAKNSLPILSIVVQYLPNLFGPGKCLAVFNFQVFGCLNVE